MSSAQSGLKSATAIPPQSSAGNLALAIASGLGIGFAVCLAVMCLMHIWLFDAQGHPDVLDFISYWSVGHMVREGAALAAYDPHLQHAAEVATVGHTFRDILGWSYPPLFFFAAAAFASLPLAPAFVLWNGATLFLQGGVVAAITRRRVVFFASWAAPWAMLDMVGGQNGLLTAAIVGGVLLTLERRPALSGILLGLLSYKPQFGLLFPFALAFGGYWRAFGWACGATIGWTALSGATFGFGTLPAFLRSLSTMAQTHLVTNHVGAWSGGLQSLYGLARWMGATDALSWSMQVCMSAACLGAVSWIWRSRTDFALKAAALAAALPLATPYVFVYDLPVLSVALAFLYRHARFDRVESLVFAFALVCVLAFPLHPYPAGLFACSALEAAILRRYLRHGDVSSSEAAPALLPSGFATAS
jgi:arabinofuranan 3-O-arabinosyltransferase